MQLFDSLLPGINVEIVEASLPKASRLALFNFAPELQLVRIPSSWFLSQGSRHALLQDLHHGARRADLRLRNQKMNVLRHHHISDQQELVPCPGLVENFEEGISLSPRIQQTPPPVATASNEMQVALPIAAFERILQGQVKPTHPLQTPQRMRHPQKQRQQPKARQHQLRHQYSTLVSSTFVTRRAHHRTQNVGALAKGWPPARCAIKIPEGGLVDRFINTI